MKFLARSALAILCLFAVGVSTPGAASASSTPTASESVLLPDGTRWTPSATDAVRTGVTAQIFVGCSRGIACLFEFPNANNGYPGGRWLAVYPSGNPNFGWFNDRMSSWANNSGYRFCWYLDDQYRSTKFIMENYGPTRVVNLRSNENDRASSARPC